MSFEADTLTALEASTALAAVVGSRIYPNVMPEATPLPGPTLVFKLISDPIEMTHSGPSVLRRAHYQFDFYAVSPEDAIAGRDALNSYLSTINATIGATFFEGANHMKQSDFYERETRLFRQLVEWEIWHSP